jgi:site-specific recombinase XerD
VGTVFAFLIPAIVLVSGAQVSTADPLVFTAVFVVMFTIRLWGARRMYRLHLHWLTAFALRILRVPVGLSCLWWLITRRTLEFQVTPKSGADDRLRGRAPASVYRCWSSWNSFFGFLVVDGVVAGNPMPAVGKPRMAVPSPKPLRGEDTPEQLLRAVNHPDERQRDPWPERDVAVLALALCAGLRLSELLALRAGSVLGRPGERRVEVAGKGGRPRTVPIEPELDAVVERYLESRRVRFGRLRPGDPLLLDRKGAPLKRGGLQYLVESCYRRAGITDRVPRGAQLHALRHTFATRLAEDGANASEIMRLLGHASLTTSQGYIEVTAAQQRAAVRANRTNRALGELAD